MMRRSRESGFSLIELLVATLIFSVVFLGVLKMLDSSTKISKVESALADTQENVRYAVYHLARIARMTGGSNLPLARGGGTFQWVSLEILDNVTSSFTDDAGASHNVLGGSDVLRIRGFFESAPYFLDPTVPNAVNLSSGTVTIPETTTGGKVQDFSHPPGIGKGLVLMGRGQYAIGKVAAVSIDATNPSPNRTMTITFSTGDGGLWQSLNPNGAWVQPTFQIYRVGVLDSYNYFVDPNLQLRRWRASAANGGSGTVEPVAVNIGSLQVALGLDVSEDGVLQANEWFFSAANPNPPSHANASDPKKLPLALRITVLGRTPFLIPGWEEPATTFTVEDMVVPAAGSPARRSKWRTLRVEAALRDYVL